MQSNGCILGNGILINSLIRVLLNKKGCNLHLFVKPSAQGENQPHSVPFQTSTGQVLIRNPKHPSHIFLQKKNMFWTGESLTYLTFLCLRRGQALGVRFLKFTTGFLEGIDSGNL